VTTADTFGRRSRTIAFVAAFRAPFIDDDLRALKGFFAVRELIGHGLRHAVSVVLGVLRADAVVCWFASTYAGLAVWAARLGGVKSVVILGGVDVACDPALAYGIWRSRWRSRFVGYAIRRADRVIAGDPWLAAQARLRAAYDGANIELLPPGFDSEAWKPLGEKENVVLTVAAGESMRRVRIKGIDTLVAAARVLPNIRFEVVGVAASLVRELDPPANVAFTGITPREKLLMYYRRARVYCQPSRHEAVSYSLREAMLCGCIPVASDVGGMPTVVAGIGVLVPPGSSEELAAGILRAFTLPPDTAARARAHIVALCPKAERDARLVDLLTEFVR
jgi:glycosyltransferase involved in cell wall biosynthesis